MGIVSLYNKVVCAQIVSVTVMPKHKSLVCSGSCVIRVDFQVKVFVFEILVLIKFSLLVGGDVKQLLKIALQVLDPIFEELRVSYIFLVGASRFRSRFKVTSILSCG